MIHLLVLAAALMAPTVDPIETRLAARDAANDDAWRTVPDAAAFKAKRTAFKDEFRRRIGVQDIVRTPLNAKTVGRKDYGAGGRGPGTTDTVK